MESIFTATGCSLLVVVVYNYHKIHLVNRDLQITFDSKFKTFWRLGGLPDTLFATICLFYDVKVLYSAAKISEHCFDIPDY